jgi:hypothetical protein
MFVAEERIVRHVGDSWFVLELKDGVYRFLRNEEGEIRYFTTQKEAERVIDED